MKATTLPSSSKLAMHQALRCKACSKRTGKPCRSPAVRGWAVCRMHGAGGGAPKGEANGNYKTGEHTAELREGSSALSFVGQKRPRRLSEAGRRHSAWGCLAFRPQAPPSRHDWRRFRLIIDGDASDRCEWARNAAAPTQKRQHLPPPHEHLPRKRTCSRGNWSTPAALALERSWKAAGGRP